MSRNSQIPVPAEGLNNLLALCRKFALSEGIDVLCRELGRFRTGAFVAACASRLGYVVNEGNRGRMLRLFLEMAIQTGWIRREHGLLQWDPSMGPTAPWTSELGDVSGELLFFGTCLAFAPKYLRCRGRAIDFGPNQESLWDEFLSDHLYELGRRWILAHAAVEDGPDRWCLDIGYGTGCSTEALCRYYPQARKVAIDVHDSYKVAAQDRANAMSVRQGSIAHPVYWMPSSLWARGYEGDLPFDSEVFDLVFLSCGSPYVHPERRKGFWAEMYRVLRPGGRACVLTWSYPEENRMSGLSPETASTRLRCLAHDFCESVCAGWSGFSSVDAMERLFLSSGFVPTPALNGRFHGIGGAGWVAEKPPLP